MNASILLMLVLSMATASRAEHRLVEGNTRFALDLYGRLRERDGNLFVSPFSLSTALAMTYAGARGETARQMATVLHLPQDPEAVHSGFKGLIDGVHGAGSEPGPARPFELALANALWAQRGDPIRPDFVRTLADNYWAAIETVDFGDTDHARQLINGWVEEHTLGKIKDLLQPPHPSPDTALVLTNAIYFRGTWAETFPKGATRDEPFTTADGRRVEVPLMHQAHDHRYLDGGTFQAIDLPYQGGALSMVVLLPKQADGLAELERSLSPDRLGRCLSGLSVKKVELSLPRFRIETGFALERVLPAMGMPTAFGPGADFSGIDGTRRLSISAVLHKAYVDVNEQGTEAAAATAVTMLRSKARPDRPVTFRVDHPFLFLIRDQRSGSLLFLGRVTNPLG